MEFKLQISSKGILDKVFKSTSKGYDPLEVDQFLDRILCDYREIESKQTFANKELEKVKEENDKLAKRIYELESNLASYKAKYSNLKPNDKVNLDNINYIRRINELETFLFKNGFDPSKIK